MGVAHALQGAAGGHVTEVSSVWCAFLIVRGGGDHLLTLKAIICCS